jgi:sugar phosphate isomerase/epimerase
VRARGAQLCALRADVGGRRLADRQHLDVNISRLREAFQLASDIGVSRVVVPAGFVVSEKEDASGHAALSEGARALAAIGAVSGVRIAWLAGSETSDALRAFLDNMDSSGVLDVDLNPGGFVMRGQDPLKALADLSNRVAILRAADHYRGGAEAPFGSGDVRWGEVIVGLSGLQRSQPIDVLAACTLDGDRVAALTLAVKKLQALRNNPMG